MLVEHSNFVDGIQMECNDSMNYVKQSRIAE